MGAAAVARCVPEKSFFDFIGKLFETQNEWAFRGNYRDNLVQIAEAYGADTAKAKRCLDDKTIATAITEKLSQAGKTHTIDATPTFIANGMEKINCEEEYSCFQEYIDSKIGSAK